MIDGCFEKVILVEGLLCVFYIPYSSRHGSSNLLQVIPSSAYICCSTSHTIPLKCCIMAVLQSDRHIWVVVELIGIAASGWW